jgi:hypothetical protein
LPDENNNVKLTKRIREDRIRQRVKMPLPETNLAAVAAIVLKYDLQVFPREESTGREKPTEAEPCERLSLFPLLTLSQWRLALEITARFDNPYLKFCRSPTDIIISQRLYESNPDLEVEALQEQSLRALWEREIFL